MIETNQKTTNNIEWKVQSDFVPYEEAQQWMESRVKAIQNKEAPECVWLLEHSPLYTLGTSGHTTDILASSKFPIFKTGRGGQVTYHGPGQRIAYLMLDLKIRYEDIRRYVFELEEWLINTLNYLGIKGERRPGRVGIWVQKEGQDYKIAALGVRVQKWVTSHGIALNVSPDLSHYNDIIPCGLSQYGITSLADLGLSTTMEEVDDLLQTTSPFNPCF
jgi:lipoyl(octanoyl) transferase